jgi:hypothetical protein
MKHDTTYSADLQMNIAHLEIDTAENSEAKYLAMQVDYTTHIKSTKNKDDHSYC